MVTVSALFMWELLLQIRLLGSLGLLGFAVIPEDACVCSGEEVQFNCIGVTQTRDAMGDLVNITTAQRWEIVTVNSGNMTVDSTDPDNIPPGYQFIINSNSFPEGLIVNSAADGLDGAMFTCIRIPNSLQEEDIAAPAVMLEVTARPDPFTCDNVLCPSPFMFNPSSDRCIVTWTRPETLCSSLTALSITVAYSNSTVVHSISVSVDDLSGTTGALEPAQSYRATVTATGSCGGNRQCSTVFNTHAEERPAEFTVDILLSFSATAFALTLELSSPSSQPRVDEYLVSIVNETSYELLGQSFPGDSSSLSLDISSLQQCMNYTVSVTATNTGGSTTASAVLFLNFITALDVLCVVGDADCYLEATYVTDHPELVSVCTLNYTREGGPVNTVTQTHSTSSDRITLRATVPCENQTIFYEGYVHDQHMNTLGCTHSGMTVCPLVICPPLLSLPHGSVSYSSVSVGSMAVYSCDTGYLLEGDCHRLCQNNRQWSGAQPHCKDNVSPWFGVSIFLLICFVLSMIVIVALTLKMFVDRRKRSGSHSVRGSSSRTTHETVELSENVCYGPVAPPQSGATQTGATQTGATQTVEYEEIGALTTTTTGKTPAEKK